MASPTASSGRLNTFGIGGRMMATPWRVYLVAGIVSAVVSTAVSFAILRIVPAREVAPQQAQTPPGSQPAAPTSTVVDEGEVEITAGGPEQKGAAEVFYRVKFAS